MKIRMRAAVINAYPSGVLVRRWVWIAWLDPLGVPPQRHWRDKCMEPIAGVSVIVGSFDDWQAALRAAEKKIATHG